MGMHSWGNASLQQRSNAILSGTLPIRWSPRIPARLLTIPRAAPASQQTTIKVASTWSSELESLASWLKQRGEHEATLALEAGVSAEGRALFTSRPVKVGEVVLRVSRALIITPKRLPQSIIELLPKDITEHGMLALFILIQQHAGEASPWAPYIQCLPTRNEVQSTIFWTDDELQLVQLSPVYTETVYRKARIAEEFASLTSVVERYPDLFGKDLDAESYSYAYALALSRSWGMEALGSLAMIPFADFFNHSADCRTPLLYMEDRKCAEVVAEKDYPAGSQIHLTYGPLRNADLALGFGFTLPHNSHDEVEIWIQLSPDDPLWDPKLQLLHQHGIKTHLLQNDAESGGNWFKLREIQSPAGMGKGLPLGLRSFARVMTCTTSEELSAMADDVKRRKRKLGQLPFKDSREGRAMETLFTLVDTLLNAYTRAMEHAQAAVAEQPRIAPERGAMALAILAGELRVLWSVRAWLRPRAVM